MGIRDFVESKNGRGVSVAFAAVMIFGAAYVVYLQFGSSHDAKVMSERVFIDAENGQQFQHTLSIGETVPILSPSTGKNTGFPAEACYWTKDGKVKADPTYVLLNEFKGKRGPTFCPDCGRLVVARNPPASTNATPPPTQAEYELNH